MAHIDLITVQKCTYVHMYTLLDKQCSYLLMVQTGHQSDLFHFCYLMVHSGHHPSVVCRYLWYVMV